MDAALSQVITTLLQLGFPGVVICGLAYWIYRMQDRNNDLTDKLMTVTSETTKAASEMSAAMNRLTDSILRGKTE